MQPLVAFRTSVITLRACNSLPSCRRVHRAVVATAKPVKVARRTRGIIWQNFAGTLAIDLIGIVLAAFGLLLAAFIHVTSELALS
jgi:hypothetical protein